MLKGAVIISKTKAFCLNVSEFIIIIIHFVHDAKLCSYTVIILIMFQGK